MKLVTDGRNYVVKRYKVSFQKCRDKCFRKEAIHIWYDRQLISGEPRRTITEQREIQ
jgi:hypothetical protein